jgi:hypothetical protein
MNAADWPYVNLPFTFRNRQRLLDKFSSCTGRFSASTAPQPTSAVIVRNDSEGFGVVPHKYCLTGTFSSDFAHGMVFSQITFKENWLICLFTFIYRSKDGETDAVESINEGNAPKELVKNDYVPLAFQRNAQIEDHLFGTSTSSSSVVFTLSQALIDFESVRVSLSHQLKILKPLFIGLSFIICLIDERPLNLTMLSSMLYNVGDCLQFPI